MYHGYMIISGKKISDKESLLLKESFKKYPQAEFHIVKIAADAVIDTFVDFKKKMGKKLGVSVYVHNLNPDTYRKEFEKIIDLGSPVILQLPLPDHIDTQELLDLIPQEQDVDVLSEKHLKMSPYMAGVPGAICMVLSYIFKQKGDFFSKKITLLGYGTLVGKPFARLLRSWGLSYNLIDIHTDPSKKKAFLHQADIVISGVGKPYLLKKEDIKKNAIVIDAGTSEISKRIVGDVHPELHEKSSFSTTVPGGIGPLTIIQLFKNILTFYDRKNSTNS